MLFSKTIIRLNKIQEVAYLSAKLT